jgi:XapX domain-containing protein
MLGFPLLDIPLPSPPLLAVLVTFAVLNGFRQMESFPSPTTLVQRRTVFGQGRGGGAREGESQSIGRRTKMALDVYPRGICQLKVDFTRLEILG